mmetsp:Transcript_20667/g.31380  ORF Transcript_20667/g.31380 Transcript_20667/m.31380 type:complete len:440 (-) Transcript_20667:76-1395(-)
MMRDDEVDHAAISMRQSMKCRSKSIDLFLSDSDVDTTAAELNILQKSAPFYKFVLTGGPCGGKTTAMARLSQYLRERGFDVFTAPEAFTILASNGFGMDYFAVEGMPHCVQNTVMDMQMALEDSFERVMRASGRKAVLLCDRGLCDGKAYMAPEEWDKFLIKRGISSAEIREGRYNAVFHMVTAAEGAESFYTLDNNEVRTETPEEARQLDKKTVAAWVGHPKLFVIDNSTDFEKKLNKLVSYISESVGLPTTTKKVKKYLLKSTPNTDEFPFDLQYTTFEVEKVYLYDHEKDDKYAEEYSFVRKRTQLSIEDGKPLGSIYGLTTVQILHNGKQIEVKRIINRREFNAAYKTRDPARNVVKQTRINFISNMQSFATHIYKEPDHVKGLCICHVQTAADEGVDGGEDGKVVMPEFLDVERLLTDKKEDTKYGAFHISLSS